jgi:alkylation response protein AidB-like acyl-CoA dehydrogenase
MELGFSEEQVLLGRSARDFLERECPISLVRAQLDDPAGLPAPLWTKMADLGWLGLCVDQRFGGSGLGPIDLAILQEELGRALAPGPFLSTAVVGARALALAGTLEQQSVWLPRIVRGELRLAFAQLEASLCWDPVAVRLEARSESGGLRLRGRKLFVPDAACADRLLVAVRTDPQRDDAIALVMVDRDAPGLKIRPIAFNEQSRKLSELTFTDVRVPSEDVLGQGDAGAALLAELHDLARVAICAELCGGARKVLDLSVAYARQREQFGQAIGRFQALQHRCADMLVQTEGMRSAAWYSAWALAEREPDRRTTAALAKAFCNDAYTSVASAGIQIHGGLGFTWEQDLHLYFKHAKAAEYAWGEPPYLREIAASHMIDGVPPAA